MSARQHFTPCGVQRPRCGARRARDHRRAGTAAAAAARPGDWRTGARIEPCEGPVHRRDGGPARRPPPGTPAMLASVQERLVAAALPPGRRGQGRWDYRTAQALMAFQAWQGLDRDGVAGPRTLAALRTARPQSRLAQPAVEASRSSAPRESPC